jgi:hypothetical protein
MNGPPVTGFSPNNVNTALLNVNGPIFSGGSYILSTEKTILYSYTDPTFNSPPNTNQDGFRMKLKRDFFSADGDALIFEKTDGNDEFVDGGIAFTNTDMSGVEVPSLYIREKGRTYVGNNILTNAQMTNRFIIDSEPGDATPAGLRFIDLTATSTTVANVGNKGV